MVKLDRTCEEHNPISVIRPEDYLLVCSAVRPQQILGEILLDLGLLKLRNLNFRYLVEQAARNSLIPQLYNFLAENLDEEILKQNRAIRHLRRLFLDRVRQNQLLLNEFTRILHRMNERNIDVMPIKGIALMTIPYFGTDRRETSDIDLMTPTLMMYGKAKVELLNMSYFPSEELMWKGEGYAWPPHLLKKDGQRWIYVDLHQTSVARVHWASRPSMNITEIWRRRVERDFSGMKVYVPSPEDCVRISCAHIFFNAEFDLRTLADIIGILRLNQKSFDWRYLIQIFTQSGSETNLYFPLCILYRTLLEVDEKDLETDLKKVLDELDYYLNLRDEGVKYWRTAAWNSSLSFPKADVFDHMYDYSSIWLSYWGCLEP